MTLPKEFSDGTDIKKALEEKIKMLEAKLDASNQQLPSHTNPYHIHKCDVETMDDVKRMEQSIDRKMKKIKSPKKGIKLKTLLIFTSIFVFTFCVSMYVLYYQPLEQPIEPKENTAPLQMKVTDNSMQAKCERAKTANPQWFSNNC